MSRIWQWIVVLQAVKVIQADGVYNISVPGNNLVVHM